MKNHHGSCHCGAIAFELTAHLTQETLRCNCSYCLKVRSWAVMTAPDALHLLAGASTLTEYQFGNQHERHYFCGRCGVRIYSRGHSPTRGAFVAVSVTCLDTAGAPELEALPITYVDGRNDNWSAPPAHTGHL